MQYWCGQVPLTSKLIKIDLKYIDVSNCSISNTPSPDQDTFQLRRLQSSSRRVKRGQSEARKTAEQASLFLAFGFILMKRSIAGLRLTSVQAQRLPL